MIDIEQHCVKPAARRIGIETGIQIHREFEKIAIYGNKGWQEMSAKIGSWFISGEVKYFDDYDEALAWLR